MSVRKSAGILLYKLSGSKPMVLLAHPGGPFFAKKDQGHWSIPKGEFIDEDPFEAALREFHEETGFMVSGPKIELSPVKIKSGKLIFAFAIEFDIDPEKSISNHFELEWPPRSGQMKSFPEVDRVAWFDLDSARAKITPGQLPILEQFAMIIQQKS